MFEVRQTASHGRTPKLVRARAKTIEQEGAIEETSLPSAWLTPVLVIRADGVLAYAVPRRSWPVAGSRFENKLGARRLTAPGELPDACPSQSFYALPCWSGHI
jgi:hypothetical protein